MNDETQDSRVHTLSICVANRPGVLVRVAQIFSRRGYNIDSLVVSPSLDGRYSRMTIAAKGSIEGLEQVMQQLGKIVDVIHCTDHALEDVVVKELALVKVIAEGSNRTEALQIAEHFGCKTVDMTENSMIVMVHGNSSKVDACVDMLRKFEMVEIVRTGQVAMARGAMET